MWTGCALLMRVVLLPVSICAAQHVTIDHYYTIFAGVFAVVFAGVFAGVFERVFAGVFSVVFERVFAWHTR